MATAITELIPMMTRELNAPGVEQLPDISAGQLVGYIEDGFWDIRLAGMLKSFVVVDGSVLTPAQATGSRWITDRASLTDDLEEQYWMMIVLSAGFRLLRLKIMNLAVNFKAEAGPVSYEQQASATVLRALLDSFTKRMNELRVQYSEDFYQTAFIAWDGVAQDQYATLNGLQNQAIYY